MLKQKKLPFPFNLINQSGEMLARLGRKKPRLDINEIQEQASKTTGLSDFGSPHFAAGMAAFLTAGREDGLNYFGRMMVEALALEHAKTRLEWMAAQKLWPDAFATNLLPPIIVTGLPRSGTTFLHRLLAADSANQAIPLWRLLKPFPPTNGRSDTRYQEIVGNQGMMDKMQPEMRHKHEMTAETPEECMILQSFSFNSVALYATTPVRSYLDWFFTAERESTYQEYASVLRWYQSLDVRRLVMKSPSHMSELRELVTAVPNALIVQTHRDPVNVVNSTNSLFHTIHAALMQPYAPDKMVAANLQMLDRFIDGNTTFRETHNHNIFDVRYDDLVQNPMGTVQQIYAHFGVVWTEAYAQELTTHIAENRRGKHGQHQYGSSDFDMTDNQIRERFADYIARYNL